MPGGGATSFVRANVSVRPEAGTALFWYNLKPSGEGDERTVHGACELTAGEKRLGRRLHQIAWLSKVRDDEVALGLKKS